MARLRAHACALLLALCMVLLHAQPAASARAPLFGTNVARSPPPPPKPRPLANATATALLKVADVLGAISEKPPIPTSINSLFAWGVFLFPRLAEFQPLVDKLSAPPGPPLLSTVDPTAFVYIPNLPKP